MFRIVAFACLVAFAIATPPLTRSKAEVESLKAALENSARDDGKTLEERMDANPQANVWENSGKFEGDVILGADEIEEMVDDFSHGRMAYIRRNSKWPSATAVYEFGANEFNLQQQRHILDVMNWMTSLTCVRFRQRNSNDRNYVRITGRSDGCYASVGYDANMREHTLNLARANPGQGCLNPIVIVHEWYHVFGFFHMQSTYNRYDYVRIHWENIVNGMTHNFDRYDNTITNNLGLEYDYSSMMHYGTHAFSTNGRPTLSTTRHYNGLLGQTDFVSSLDNWRLGRHYNCPGAWSDIDMEEAKRTIYVPDQETVFKKVVLDKPLFDNEESVEAKEESVNEAI